MGVKKTWIVLVDSGRWIKRVHAAGKKEETRLDSTRLDSTRRQVDQTNWATPAAVAH